MRCKLGHPPQTLTQRTFREKSLGTSKASSKRSGVFGAKVLRIFKGLFQKPLKARFGTAVPTHSDNIQKLYRSFPQFIEIKTENLNYIHFFRVCKSFRTYRKSAVVVKVYSEIFICVPDNMGTLCLFTLVFVCKYPHRKAVILARKIFRRIFCNIVFRLFVRFRRKHDKRRSV